MSEMGKITTHILDTAAGKPAAGVRVWLYRARPGIVRRDSLFHGKTNDDGRIDGALLEGAKFTPGIYELNFFVGDYFGDDCFYDVVEVRFVVKDASVHYHIPLLVSPYGYTTYRGS